MSFVKDLNTPLLKLSNDEQLRLAAAMPVCISSAAPARGKHPALARNRWRISSRRHGRMCHNREESVSAYFKELLYDSVPRPGRTATLRCSEHRSELRCHS